MIDNKWMKRALHLAEKGMGYTSPNPMVGAVIVDDVGNFAGEGYHIKAGTPHAEVNAIRAAGDKTKGATLYVNLEPCSHHGRTPPCAEAIVKAGLKTVVVGMVDPNPLVAGRGINFLQEQGIQVITGMMTDEAEELNRAFVKYITTKRPYVTLKVAMSLDGKIATVTGESKWITGELARQKVHGLRHEADAVLVGINTILVDNPSLNTRLENQTGKDPIRVVLDSKLRLPLDSRLVTQQSTAKTIVFTGQGVEQKKVQQLTRLGIIVIKAPVAATRIELNWVMTWLGAEGVTHLLLEGGSEVNFSAIAAGVVDEFWCFLAPKIIGGKTAPTGVGGAGVEKLANAYELTNISVGKIGPDILVKGYFKRELED